MHQYLALKLFQEMYGAIEWAEAEVDMINSLVDEAKRELTDEQIKIVENRTRRMKNEYEEWSLENLKSRYWHEFNGEDYEDDDDEYFYPQIDYDKKFYEIWKSAVAKRQTVRLKYDSTTSGVSTRLVDPYYSRAPYGEGYCHNRKEVRKFRFDRVIDIKLTDEKFEKPKDWKTL